MAVYGPGDIPYTDEFGQEIIPPGRTINSMPETMTATPGSPGGPEISTPQGGQVSTRVINTPDSSRGTPFRYSPSALQPSTQQVGSPNTITPSSRTGAPPPAIQNEPIPRSTFNPGLLAGGLVGLAAGMPSTDQGIYNNANAAGSSWDNSPIGRWMIQHGLARPSSTWGNPAPAPAVAPGSQTSPVTATAPITQPGSGILNQGRGSVPPPPPPPPPFGPAPPPSNLPPFVRGPIPAAMPQRGGAPAQRAGAPNLGYGIPGAAPAAASQAPSPMFTTIDRPNADVAGGRSVAGQLAPQYFNRAREPGGPAQMGALDLSGLFSHPAVAQAAAQHPMVQAAARQPVQGPLSALAPRAQAPMMQRQPAATGLVGYGRVGPQQLRRVGVQDVMGP